VLPVTTDGQVALIRSWRVAVRQWCLEAPAGRIDPGELPAGAARRELAEEVGGQAAALVPLGEVFASAGSSNERVHMFLGLQVVLTSARPDPDENLTLELVTVAQALDLARSGQITDPPTALAIFLARDHGLLPDGGER
jgi:ADP-ribose pyrophosphatase